MLKNKDHLLNNKLNIKTIKQRNKFFVFRELPDIDF